MTVNASDLQVVAGQLRRFPRDVTGVAVRCCYGYPVVVETAPVLSDGTPWPTLLYLTCPALVALVSKAEAAGGVREFRTRYRSDIAFRGLVEQLTALYQRRRAALAGGDHAQARLGAGIGGPENPERATCLHAYVAAVLAVQAGWLKAPAPVGQALAGAVQELLSLQPDSQASKNSRQECLELDHSIAWCSKGDCVRWTSEEGQE